MNYKFEISHLNHEIIKIICKANVTNYIFVISSIGNKIHTEWWNEYKKYFKEQKFYELWNFLNYTFTTKDDNLKILLSHEYLDILLVIIKYKHNKDEYIFKMEFKREFELY